MKSQLSNNARQDRAIRLFTYLKELTELRSKPIRSIDQFEQVLWISDVPSHTFVKSVFDDPEDARSEVEFWLEIRKPRPLASPPSVHPSSLGGFRSRTSTTRLGQHCSCSIKYQNTAGQKNQPDTNDPDAFEFSSDHPELQEVLAEYVSTKWMPWAEHDRSERKLKHAYDTLFAIYQAQATFGRVVRDRSPASDCSTWQPSDAEGVYRHIVVIPASVLFDSLTGTISLVPGPDGAEPTLEQDMLHPEHRPLILEKKSVSVFYWRKLAIRFGTKPTLTPR